MGAEGDLGFAEFRNLIGHESHIPGCPLQTRVYILRNWISSRLKSRLRNLTCNEDMKFLHVILQRLTFPMGTLESTGLFPGSIFLSRWIFPPHFSLLFWNSFISSNFPPFFLCSSCSFYDWASSMFPERMRTPKFGDSAPSSASLQTDFPSRNRPGIFKARWGKFLKTTFPTSL